MNDYRIIKLVLVIYVRNLYLKDKARFIFDVINDIPTSIIFMSFEENAV
jgi:hypothetical protein